MKYCQFPTKNYFNRSLRESLVQDHEKHLNKISEQLVNHKKILNGIHYDVADVRAELEKHSGNEGVLIHVDPPGTKKGYEHMFDFNGQITWNEPKFDQIDSEEFRKMLNSYQKDKSTISYTTTAEDVPAGWNKLFAEFKGDTPFRMVSNKKFDMRHIARKKQVIEKTDWPLYNESEITKHSKINVVRIGKDAAYYYRDLFIHRLGSTGAEITVGLLLDNKLMSVIGFNTSFLFGIGGGNSEKSTKNYIHEVFGLTIPSKKYKRLGRLFMYLLTSESFQNDLLRIFPVLSMANMTSLRTVSLTRLPEHRIVHGILKLTERTKLKNDFYKLVYDTEFHKRNYKQCLILWLDELRREELRNAKA